MLKGSVVWLIVLWIRPGLDHLRGWLLCSLLKGLVICFRSNIAESSPASVLYKWFGKREWDKIATDSRLNIT